MALNEICNCWTEICKVSKGMAYTISILTFFDLSWNNNPDPDHGVLSFDRISLNYLFSDLIGLYFKVLITLGPSHATYIQAEEVRSDALLLLRELEFYLDQKPSNIKDIVMTVEGINGKLSH